MDDLDSEWQRKGATLSDKTARKEFGLTQDEIVQAIRAGKLQYRANSIHGNPFLRLLRREVEALVKKKHGDDFLKDRQAKTELARIDGRAGSPCWHWLVREAIEGLRGHGITSVVSAPTCPGSSGDPGSGQWVRSFSRR
jgi:hypothetical protein